MQKLKNTNIVCVEELHFLNCMLLCPHPVVTSVFVSGFISSVTTAVITIIVCLVMLKRRRPKDSVTSTTSPGPIYDDIAEINQQKGIVELTSNIAYASANN